MNQEEADQDVADEVSDTRGLWTVDTSRFSTPDTGESSPDTSPTLSGGELLDVLVTLGSCRLAMDHH